MCLMHILENTTILFILNLRYTYIGFHSLDSNYSFYYDPIFICQPSLPRFAFIHTHTHMCSLTIFLRCSWDSSFLSLSQVCTCLKSYDGSSGPYLIGLTGGIATGKSSIVKRLTAIGAYSIDCDKVILVWHEHEMICKHELCRRVVKD